MEKLRELIFRLCDAPGLPGSEQGVSAVLAKEIAPFADRVETDAMGNVYAWLGQSGARERVLLDAHSDQVGLIVTRVEKDGLLRVDRCGGAESSGPAGVCRYGSRPGNTAGDCDPFGARGEGRRAEGGSRSGRRDAVSSRFPGIGFRSGIARLLFSAAGSAAPVLMIAQAVPS